MTAIAAAKHLACSRKNSDGKNQELPRAKVTSFNEITQPGMPSATSITTRLKACISPHYINHQDLPSFNCITDRRITRFA